MYERSLYMPQPSIVIQVSGQSNRQTTSQQSQCSPRAGWLSSVGEHYHAQITRYTLVSDEKSLKRLVYYRTTRGFALLRRPIGQRQLGQPVHEIYNYIVTDDTLGAAGECYIEHDAKGFAINANQ